MARPDRHVVWQTQHLAPRGEESLSTASWKIGASGAEISVEDTVAGENVVIS